MDDDANLSGAEVVDDAGSPSPTSPSPADAATSPARRRRTRKAKRVRGVCRVCGEDADGPSATYCATHRPLQTDGAPRARDVRATPDAVVDQLEANVALQLGMVAQLWAIRDPTCGQVLAETAPAIAEFWANQARKSPGIARALEAATTGGGVLAGLAVHAPLIMVVMQHHVAPVLARRREQFAGDTEPVGTSPVSPAPPSSASPPETMGSAGDPAAEAAAAWVDPTAAPLTVDAEAWATLQPEPAPSSYRDPFTDPALAMVWDSQAEVMAQEARTGMPFGQATDNGTPSWEAPADGPGAS